MRKEEVKVEHDQDQERILQLENLKSRFQKLGMHVELEDTSLIFPNLESIENLAEALEHYCADTIRAMVEGNQAGTSGG